ncbi:hypothetical protein, partial [Methanoculleus sp.]|uniref:hypothetical protein n=1 Tax=Methanoculleus sp. TaxID=90427 RepID=UPI0025ED80D3
DPLPVSPTPARRYPHGPLQGHAHGPTQKAGREGCEGWEREFIDLSDNDPNAVRDLAPKSYRRCEETIERRELDMFDNKIASGSITTNVGERGASSFAGSRTGHRRDDTGRQNGTCGHGLELQN